MSVRSVDSMCIVISVSVQPSVDAAKSPRSLLNSLVTSCEARCSGRAAEASSSDSPRRDSGFSRSDVQGPHSCAFAYAIRVSTFAS